MNINLKATSVVLTPETKEYINKRIQGLEKFLKRLDEKGAVELQMEVAQTTKHHQKGDDLYYAEINLKLPKETLRVEAESIDLHSAIDEVHEDLKRQIEKYYDIKEAKFKKGMRKLKEMLRGL
ncbi:MAG: ribosome-associated translation inhibitor RaiA [bacterium]|nr:ribosome-associated translation inhibitor RaiA [bacterium]